MKQKIKININGQDFEMPMDMSLLTGMLGMAQRPQTFGMPFPHMMRGQSSHERLEDNFFKLLDNETKTNRAIMALHRRLRVLENKCLPEEKCLPKHIEMPKFPVINAEQLRVGPEILATFMKAFSSVEQPIEKAKPMKKPTKDKSQTEAVPKIKGKTTKKLTKKK